MILASSLRLALGLYLLSAYTTTQDVVVVDAAFGAGADFLEVQDAVDAASDGDVILIRTGNYDHVTLNAKGVSLQADVDAVVRIKPPPGLAVPALRVNSSPPTNKCSCAASSSNRCSSVRSSRTST